jgi:hypothetical protein
MRHRSRPVSRSRWAALGAAVAVSIGSGGLLVASASVGSGERTVFVPITPCRIMDTRPVPDNVGPRSAALGPGDTHTIQVRGTNGNCTIPTDAVGLVLNVVVVNPTASSFLTVYPSDATARPLASNLNWTAGDAPTANAVTVRISADGRIAFYNLAGTVDVAADVAGYYADHNHDDRYDTKDQANAKVQAAVQAGVAGTPSGWGSIRDNASIFDASSNVTGVLHPGVGLYCVIFNPPIAQARLVSATISGNGSGPVIGEQTNGVGGPDSCSLAPNGVGLELRIYDAAGTLSDQRFSFVVP